MNKDRILELQQRIVEITTELSGLDRFNTKDNVRVLKLFKEFNKIEKEGKQLLNKR